jgi:hypothetical protein
LHEKIFKTGTIKANNQTRIKANAKWKKLKNKLDKYIFLKQLKIDYFQKI